MNKLLATTIFTGAILATTVNADAADRKFPYWYLGLSGGVAHQNDSEISGTGGAELEWGTGFIASASLGYQTPEMAGFRPELEYSYRQQGVEGFGDELEVHVVALNMFYDFVNTGPITPYIGAGVGYGQFDFDTGVAGIDEDSSEAVYQGMIGIGYEPTNLHNVGLTLGYRYLAPFSDPEVAGLEYEYDNHSVEAGVKFRF